MAVPPSQHPARNLLVPLDELEDPLALPRLRRPFDAVVRPPGSKSVTNRAILLAALAQGESVLHGALIDADDARRMIDAVRALGATVREVPNQNAGGGWSDCATQLVIDGVAGQWEPPPTPPTSPPAASHASAASREPLILDLGNAGTAVRFLAASAILTDPAAGPIILDGNERMRRRPIAELTSLLASLGARIDHLADSECPPIRVHPLRRAPTATPSLAVGATLSGQFVSALLLLAPFLPAGLRLDFREPPTSPAYIDMTIRLLRRVGVWVEGELPARSEQGAVIVHPAHLPCTSGAPVHTQPAKAARRIGPEMIPGLLAPFELEVEPDASGATYFWAAAAVIPGARCTIPGLGPHSLQGDARFADLLAHMGAHVEHVESRGEPTTTVAGPPSLRGIDADLATMPDAAMTLAAVACFADSPTTIRGLRTLRIKETDRLAALKAELEKIGALVEILETHDAAGRPDEAIRITPPALVPPEPAIPDDPGAAPPTVVFDTYDDHRMAMSLAVIALRRPNTLIRDPGCVRKTYPEFWRHLACLFA